MAHVLVVDDEASLRFILRLAFEGSGHTVTEAADGAAALAAIQAAKPDLVATDLMMPVMDGRELISRLRADPATARLPILLVSSSEGASRIEGADRFMQKPLNPLDVVVEAAELLSRVAS
jgi:two-component system chemotaxis response regulator CheY